MGEVKPWTLMSSVLHSKWRKAIIMKVAMMVRKKSQMPGPTTQMESTLTGMHMAMFSDTTSQKPQMKKLMADSGSQMSMRMEFSTGMSSTDLLCLVEDHQKKERPNGTGTCSQKK